MAFLTCHTCGASIHWARITQHLHLHQHEKESAR